MITCLPLHSLKKHNRTKTNKSDPSLPFGMTIFTSLILPVGKSLQKLFYFCSDGCYGSRTVAVKNLIINGRIVRRYLTLLNRCHPERK